MKLAYARFGLALALFLGWLGYLGYLVAERPTTTNAILSRPQFLVSTLDVVANVKQGSNVVTVTRVLYPNPDDARKLEGKELTVLNLEDCRPPTDLLKHKPDLTRNGEYLLALQSADTQGTQYDVTPTPPSPGFSLGTPRIYPFSKEIEAQYRQLRK